MNINTYMCERAHTHTHTHTHISFLSILKWQVSYLLSFFLIAQMKWKKSNQDTFYDFGERTMTHLVKGMQGF